MTARLDQSGMVPGANLTVRARLTQFGLPVTARSTVEVELERPDGSKAVLAMPEVEPGVFEVVTGAPMAGVYSARVLAEGTSLRNRPFTREQLLSAAVWIGGDQPPPRGGGDGGSYRDGKLCKLLLCLFTNESIQRFLKKPELDIDGVIACIKRCCEHAADNDVREVLRQEPEIVAAIGRIISDPDMRRALKRISDTTA